ncbi:hypothetical protein [Citrobacter amalonaticus]|uniref:hypothetical protein n=1 Tax=Citrobacter amalonaticus TaxID=35703 RepID=UPI001E5DDACC|nr:hypothetical protein [Citrobacter amalonaticus]
MDLEIFSVLFFYKPDRQTAPPLAACRKTQTEKIEKNFIILQFHGSKKDLTEIITIRNIREKYILCGLNGSLNVLLRVINKARNRWRGAG